MKSLTTEQFIEKATGVHGCLFDYSMVEYVSAKEKVKIVCGRHGVFEQAPTNHLSGSGCMQCRYEKWSKNGPSKDIKKKREKAFFDKCRRIHNNRFDYSESEYKGSGAKVTIGCPVHGKIEVSASSHARGFGCNACYFDSVREKSAKVFLEKSAIVHAGMDYDYSQVEYEHSKTKVSIICPVHGPFETTAYRHMSGVGCPGCVGPKHRGFIENAEKTKLTTEIFIARSIAKHGNKYGYSLVDYVKQLEKVKIICPVHNEFLQYPDAHMRGHGCQKCYLEKAQTHLVESVRKRSKETKRGYISRVKKIHDNKYDYSEVEYTTWDGSIKIICPVHGPFFQTASGHKQGHGCPQCAPSGFDETIPAILYYLEIETGPGTDPVYKIGVTNRTVWQRYPLTRDREKIKVLKEWEYPLGIDARKTETRIRRMHKDKMYQGDPPLERVGISEMFSEDVLALANQGEK